jgi:hypothetical protein
MFYCPSCGIRFSAEAASSALVCPRCQTEHAVFAPFTTWAFDLGLRTESEEGKERSDSPAREGEHGPREVEDAY